MNLSEREKNYIQEMRTGFKLGIFGSRTLESDERIREIIEDEMEKYNVKEIITAAEIKGVSEEARRIAHRKGLCQTLFSPDEKRFAEGCYHFRSILIATNSDRLLIIWDGESKGTRGEIELCRDLRLDFDLFKVKTEENFKVGEAEFNIEGV